MPAALCRDRFFTSDGGFTVLELLVVISIVGMLLAVSVPASSRFYESMQYRQAIQDVVSLLAGARHRAISTGKAQDVMFDTEYKRVTLNQDVRQLPESFTVLVSAASELGGQSQAVIRFYPEGGSSGGDVELARPDKSGVRISVDWLVGRVTQQPYAFN
ncbi:prepilin-type N-terminal cleavage/methylation domain-containing protein [Candidatus Marimicrobium litorale]|jgi:general secretion pathway protein H|uniref:Prepilin-type N-terminal cleavage/methylation domain-containing protein n=1 Tax=Candidatus Marimicrobium litorale TaxID=2518991 RepID=A0ABT3T5J4_9GAMM|nr:GspH/FimT family pseudopilin [Candidatus Marimicrobium litorale]MCX2977563.1 prepilin-type N-terminal cleavage/methylation domain-containing protein [Candidatus Marimicrobium litorale]